jgi:acetyl esterase/lipase
VERVAYGDDPSQFGELTPGGDDVAVLIHGGFWRARYDLSLMRDLAADLAARGWTTWNLEYRRLGNGGGFPATLEDVAAGVEHVRGPGRVVAIGHSAGGHLAAWAAPLVDAVVLQAGVLDLRLAWELRLSDGVVERFLGSLDDAAFAAASPHERLPIAARMLLTHGGEDDTVPVRMSEEFQQASGADLFVDPRAGHFEHLDPGHALWQAVLAWL